MSWEAAWAAGESSGQMAGAGQSQPWGWTGWGDVEESKPSRMNWGDGPPLPEMEQTTRGAGRKRGKQGVSGVGLPLPAGRGPGARRSPVGPSAPR